MFYVEKKNRYRLLQDTSYTITKHCVILHVKSWPKKQADMRYGTISYERNTQSGLLTRTSKLETLALGGNVLEERRSCKENYGRKSTVVRITCHIVLQFHHVSLPLASCYALIPEEFCVSAVWADLLVLGTGCFPLAQVTPSTLYN